MSQKTAHRLETVIGLEVHVELDTETKIFCDCPNRFGGDPNTHVCPVCLGLPGSLPVLNEQVVEFAVRAAMALNCTVNTYSKFDRKNYHYPDLPKGYQISQFDQPLAQHGWLEVETEDDGQRKIGITRIHVEEDAGKSMHGRGQTLVDYNRAGVPLIEIVTEPDLRSAEEAFEFLTQLRNIIKYTGVSDVKMEEGSLRCDANLSVRPVGSTEFGSKTEVKNMNSFRAVKAALEFEAARHRQLVENGERVPQETRHWNEDRGITTSSRSKEEANDYRYFPEPDLPPLVLETSWLESIRRDLPALPAERRQRYIGELGLPAYDAEVLTASKGLADFFEACVDLGADPKQVSNWMMGDVSAYLNEHDIDAQEADSLPLEPDQLVELLSLIEEGTISNSIAKEVLVKTCDSGRSPSKIVEAEGLKQVSDDSQIMGWVQEAVEENPDAAEKIRSGNDNVIGFLVGQVMQKSRGQANPQLANEKIREYLEQES